MLHSFSELSDFSTIIGVCRRDMQRKRVAQGGDSIGECEPRIRLPKSYPARGLLSGVECSMRVSTVAIGSEPRPVAIRKIARLS